MNTVLITGGTGLVGKALTAALTAKNYQVVILTRSLKDHSPTPQVSYAVWDVKKQTIDVDALLRADYIIHLAGAGVVDKKWTPAYKKEIIDSRTLSSKLIIDTLAKHPLRVKAFISSSAIGLYGADKTKGYAFVETDPAADGFLGEACRLWEESVDQAAALNIPVCKLRTGIVLSKEGGALAEFIKPLKVGVASILASGKQIISWIHIDDLCRMFIYAMENTAMQGAYNAVAPAPVTNKELTLKLAETMRGKFYIPMHVPAFVLKIMMGDRSEEVLKSTTVSAEKIRKQGFTFLYPTIDAALIALFKKD